MERDGKKSVGRALTDDERAVFDGGFREYKEKALTIAAAVGGDPDEAVQLAIAMMIDLVTRVEDAYPCPRNRTEFGIAFRGLVRRIARSQVRKRKVRKRRLTSFEKTLLRPLSGDEIFASDWAEAHGWDGEKSRDMIESLNAELADGEPRDEPQRPPQYRLPQWPVDRDARELELMFIFYMSGQRLPLMQSMAVEVHFWKLPRGASAALIDVSPKTYDEHLARACMALPWLLQRRWWMTLDARGRRDAAYRSDWNDVISEMFKRFVGRHWQAGVDRLARLQAGEEVEGLGDEEGDAE
jgi:hypothetical protein